MPEPALVEIPARFRARAESQAHWSDWYAELPRLLRGVLADWQLRPDGPTLSGDCAVVVPVRTSEGRAAALKVGWPHWEAETEHLALRAWNGEGAVRLYRADPHRFALLLERLEAGRDLATVPVLEASEIIGGLYARLHRPALPQTRRLSDMCRDWQRRMGALTESGLVPRRLGTQAASLLGSFSEDDGVDFALVHTDLHHHNVLAAERETVAGDRSEAAGRRPGLRGCAGALEPLGRGARDDNARKATLAKMFTMIDVAGLDEDRVRDWVVVRVMCNVLWELENARLGAQLNQGYITSCHGDRQSGPALTVGSGAGIGRASGPLPHKIVVTSNSGGSRGSAAAGRTRRGTDPAKRCGATAGT